MWRWGLWAARNITSRPPRTTPRAWASVWNLRRPDGRRSLPTAARTPPRPVFTEGLPKSHNHTDNLDGEPLGPLLKANPRIAMVAPAANRDFIANRLGVDPSFPVGLRDAESAEIGPFRFTAVPAAHEE